MLVTFENRMRFHSNFGNFIFTKCVCSDHIYIFLILFRLHILSYTDRTRLTGEPSHMYLNIFCSHSGIFTVPENGLYQFIFAIDTYGYHQTFARLVVDGVNMMEAVAGEQTMATMIRDVMLSMSD